MSSSALSVFQSGNLAVLKREKRSFRADSCQQFEWRHYDAGADAAS